MNSGKRKANTSANNVSSESQSKQPTKEGKKNNRKSKAAKKSKTDSTDVSSAPKIMANVNNVQSQGHESNIINDSSFISMGNLPAQFIQQPQTFQQFPSQQPVQYCSTPNTGYVQSTHFTPPFSNQRPAWVDDLFKTINNIESRLCKLDQIDKMVTSINAKVINMEEVTKSLNERLTLVEHASQHISDQYDDQNSRYSEIKTSVTNVEKNLKSQSTNVTKIERKINDTREEIDNSLSELKKLNDKVQEELIDTQLRANMDNLVFYNVAEDNGEDCINVIMKFCDEKLKIDNVQTSVKILSANRMGNKGQHIRPILVKFASFAIRDLVKKSAKNLKDTNFGISEHLPGEIQKRRKEQLPLLKQLRERGTKAYFVRDKIFVGGREFQK